MMEKPVDPEITDLELDAEIELLADVMDAVGTSRTVLSQEQIDEALHVRKSPERCHGSSSRAARPTV